MKRLSLALGTLALAAVLAACSSGSGGAAPSVGSIDPTAPLIVAKNNQFAPTEIRVVAGTGFPLTLDNQDGVPHNVAIFTDSSASSSISAGEILSSAKTTQQVPPLTAGSYFFRCDVHHEMTGTIVAQ
jgi:plastocyanin